MKKFPVILFMAGLASLAVGCSHNKQKIVFVTEFLECGRWQGGFGGCDGVTGKNYRYIGFNGKTLPREVHAASSVCAENSMSKEDFTDKVNTDKFRVVSTTDWEGIFGSYKEGLNNWGTRPWEYGKRKVRCIGKEYVVTY